MQVKSLQTDFKLRTSQLHDFRNRLELLQSQIRSSSPSVSVLTLCIPSTILRFFSIIPRPLLKGRCFSDSCMKVVIYCDYILWFWWSMCSEDMLAWIVVLGRFLFCCLKMYVVLVKFWLNLRELAREYLGLRWYHRGFGFGVGFFKFFSSWHEWRNLSMVQVFCNQGEWVAAMWSTHLGWRWEAASVML